jgi:hypothetical protein
VDSGIACECDAAADIAAAAAAAVFALLAFGSTAAVGFATAFATAFASGLGADLAGLGARTFASGFLAAGFSGAVPASFCVSFPTLIVPRGSIFGSRDGVRAETTLSIGFPADCDPLPEPDCAPPTDLRPFESDADEPETLRLPRADESLAIDRRG